MKSCDVIVVGAGPAGCAAAYDLAAANVRVLLLDRKEFPRLKPCAGALTIKAVARLRYSIAPVIRSVVRNLEIGFGKEGRRLASRHPVAVMTVRQELDAFCLAQTLAKGAFFERIDRLSAIAADADHVLVETGTQVLRCRFLVGADGAGSQVRRLIRRPPLRLALALEGRVGAQAASAAMRFDFGAVPGGYGWVFPKGDHANIGLYSQHAGIELRKRDLVDYAQSIVAEDVQHVLGFPIGIAGEHEQARDDRILLVGDAAGMTEPLLGEGIHNAIKTGQAAASAIVAALRRGGDAGRRFEKATRDVHLDLKACSRASAWFYAQPESRHAQLLSHRKWMPLMRGFAAGKTFRDIVRTYPFSRFYRIAPVRAVVDYERKNPPGAPTLAPSSRPAP